MPGVAQTFKTVINKVTHGTDVILHNEMQVENLNLTREDLNTSIDNLDNRWNILHVSYDTFTS
jgi:D-ribose pyranose/furanose isomerase RbsD